MAKSVIKTLLENSAYDEQTRTLFMSAPGISFAGLKALAKNIILQLVVLNLVNMSLFQHLSNLIIRMFLFMITF